MNHDDYLAMNKAGHRTTHVTCDNCITEVPEGELTLVEVHTSRGVEEMKVCEYCARPIEVYVMPLAGGFWAYYVDGLGSRRKEVEVLGDTKEECIQKFREEFVNVFNRDLVNLIVK